VCFHGSTDPTTGVCHGPRRSRSVIRAWFLVSGMAQSLAGRRQEALHQRLHGADGGNLPSLSGVAEWALTP
jgi:hypothetical protein